MGEGRYIRLGDTTAKMRGDVIIEDHGRTPGIQQNDASETFAVLQSLLNTHTADDMKVYCDNQGCVNIWDMMIVRHDAGSSSQGEIRGYVEQNRQA